MYPGGALTAPRMEVNGGWSYTDRADVSARAHLYLICVSLSRPLVSRFSRECCAAAVYGFHACIAFSDRCAGSDWRGWTLGEEKDLPQPSNSPSRAQGGNGSVGKTERGERYLSSVENHVARVYARNECTAVKRQLSTWSRDRRLV